MKKILINFSLCAVFFLCTNPTATAKLFVIEVDGQRIVVDYWVAEEQAWQFSGAWPGLTPHPYEYKIWYPFLANSFDMTFEQQLKWIEKLNYAGIRDWDIGY